MHEQHIRGQSNFARVEDQIVSGGVLALKRRSLSMCCVVHFCCTHTQRISFGKMRTTTQRSARIAGQFIYMQLLNNLWPCELWCGELRASHARVCAEQTYRAAHTLCHSRMRRPELVLADMVRRSRRRRE